MMAFQFLGYPEYIASVANRVGRPELTRKVGRIAHLSSIATLCVQALHSRKVDAQAILQAAGSYRDQLAIAAEVAEAMIVDLERACQVSCAPSRELTDSRRSSKSKPPTERATNSTVTDSS